MQLLLKKSVLLTILTLTLMISCSKKDNMPIDPDPVDPPVIVDPPPFTGPFLKTVLDQAGHTIYTFDGRKRVVNIHTDYDLTVREYIYTDTTVKLNRYDRDAVFQYTVVYQLNNNGLATSMTDTVTRSFETYTYNAARQVTRVQAQRDLGGGQQLTFDTKYFYTDGDLDSTTAFASNTGLTSTTYYTEYDRTKINTLGNDNMGLSFLGSSSKHPVKKVTLKSGDVLYDYVYTYDADNKITQEDVTIAGGALQLPFVFTYY